MKYYTPTVLELAAAREAFIANESRDLFYRAATELVDRAIARQSSLSVPEALAVLLQTWNKAVYQYKKFDNQHFAEIERVVSEYEHILMALRPRAIASLSDTDATAIKAVFKSFEEVLGPVGAAKSLHLWAPRFFPLWDRAIAYAYDCSLRQRGRNGDLYYRFMEITKAQCQALGDESANGHRLLKALDEYNYCKYTKGWI